MKLSKVIVSLAAVALVTDIVRRTVTEIRYKRMEDDIMWEMFGWGDYEEFRPQPVAKKLTPAQEQLAKKNAQRKALLAEQDYLLASLSDAISTQDTDTIAKDKARLAEINTELEELK